MLAFFFISKGSAMTLSQKISEDMKLAMKSGEKLRLETLRSIRAQMIELTKRGTGSEITPEEEISAVLAAAKKRKEAIELYRQAGREELARQEEQELEIINTYLPKQMSKEEAETLIGSLVTQTGAASMKDIGKVMPLAMKELKGKIDGKIVQEIVKQKLGGN
jgi:uncharacterized protein